MTLVEQLSAFVDAISRLDSIETADLTRLLAAAGNAGAKHA